MNLNKVMLIGNITRDPELRTTPAGDSVASFSIATNFTWKDRDGNKQEKAEFHNIVAWRKLAEIIGQYLKKGSKIYIEGRLQTRDWEDQNGVKRYRTEVIAENMIMLDSKGGQSNDFAPAPQSTNQDEQPAPPAEDEINVEDIPF
ncbi:MAG: single-stranded DNA-binding protein [Candidatus Komeilibacteria bacterium]